MLCTAEAAREHAYRLAQQLNVELVEAPLPAEAAAAVSRAGEIDGRRVIITPVVIDEVTYAAVLHELGHFAAPNAFGTSCDREVQRTRERAAWAWARTHALDWTPTMEHVAQVTYDTYCRVHMPKVAMESISAFLRRRG